MNDLEQANKILAQAESVLEQSTQNLEKSQTFNELMVEQNRRLSFALSNLLPKQYVLTLNPCEEKQLTELAKAMKSGSFEVIAEELAENFKQREAYDIVHSINVLAMANTDILNIHTNFRGCGNLFVVRVRPLSAISPDGDEYSLSPVVYREEVSLVDGFYVGCPTGDCPIQRLLRIESEITELIIEAREEAEAEVKA
ncbi:hypothetical protein [Vibrio scophthalmi]|uniref:Uncharacterized protein n=1 Tax=Vibrio scophthalmi LMG 19158 TaxID=870967 RepID=F9RKV6_9VIBR|nr:hypothetical protein [Vibrio scophthalmi]EGU39430.1 hypothetical protein VIS19158_04031 [Vibrio scophthalmi LMG 19158]